VGVPVSRKGWILFAIMCVVWGIPYLLIKVAVGGVAVPVVVFARTALGAMILLPLAFRSGQLTALRGHWLWLVAFTGLEVVGPWGLLSQAERQLPSSLAGLLVAAVPTIGVVIARLTGGTERLGRWRWAGLVLGLAGVAVLAAPDLDGGSGWAVTEVLLVAVGYASAPIIVARKLADVPSLVLTAACLSLAAIVYAPAAIVSWPHRVPGASVLAALAALGIVCTACAFIVFFELIREVGTSRAMVFTYVNPVVAVAAGVTLLAEPLTATMVGSFALILAGCLLATGSVPARLAGQAPGPRAAPSGEAPAPPSSSPARRSSASSYRARWAARQKRRSADGCPMARSAMISPVSGANLAPCPEQGEATTNGPAPGRSRMKSSLGVRVYRQVTSLRGAGSRPGSR
jgi:drug/metabolite transporter (DMT)-like permease